MINRYRSHSVRAFEFEAKILARWPKTAFVGQSEYFRQNFFDALNFGHTWFEVKSSDPSKLTLLPEFVTSNKIEQIIAIRPEWFRSQLNTFRQLKDQKIRMIGYATEPIPFPSVVPHQDQLVRLDNLKEATFLDWDLIVHYDLMSLETVRSLGFSCPVISHPLPLSFELFFEREDSVSQFDSIFIGRFTEYREKFLLPLKVSTDSVHIAHGLHDEWACYLINQSRSVVNIHNLQYLNFETRVVQSLLCGKPCFSQRLTWDPFPENPLFIEFQSPAELYEKVNELRLGKKISINRELNQKQLTSFHIESFFEKIENFK